MKKIDKSSYIKDINLQDAYYFVRWSDYFKYNKFDILQTVPELSGIFVVFYKSLRGTRINPFYLGNSWMGSLRHDLKFLIEEPAQVNKKITQILEEDLCFYKYLIIPSFNDLVDIYMYYRYYYKDIMFAEENITEDSKRYANIFVKEYDIK